MSLVQTPVQTPPVGACKHLPLGVAAEGVHGQLERILGSKAFAGANRHRDFLRYVVCGFLEGRDEELKEYNIALDVFGRHPSFDPKIDPIVRVEACRLRSRLAAYLSKEGDRDELIIELSKRGYVPIVRKSAIQKRELSVAVLPFLDLNANSESSALISGLTEELIDMLTDVPGIRVSPRTAVFHFMGRGSTVRMIGKQLKAELLLEGSIRQMGQRVLVRTRLINVTLGFAERLSIYDGQTKNLPIMVHEISASIVAELKQQFLPADTPHPANEPVSRLEPFSEYAPEISAAAMCSSVACSLPE
jgi:serine/threonine-protein kinase